MQFGSKYVYCYPESDEECVSDEEYSVGIIDETYVKCMCAHVATLPFRPRVMNESRKVKVKIKQI